MPRLRSSTRTRSASGVLTFGALALVAGIAFKAHTFVLRPSGRRSAAHCSTGSSSVERVVARRSFADRWSTVEDRWVGTKDGDSTLEDEEDDAGPELDVRALRQRRGGTKFKSGQTVKARWDDGQWYPATVLSVQPDGTLTLRWAEWGMEKGISTSRVRQVKKGAAPVSELQVGMKLSGEVTRIQSYGAFVDVGAEWDGLVPWSKMVAEGDEGGLGSEDSVQIGQKIDVWVSNVRDDGALELTMVESKVGGVQEGQRQRLQAADLQVGQELTGRVARILHYGAFIDVGAAKDGLVHKSKMPVGRFVELNVGMEVKATVSKIRPEGSIELSMLDQSSTPELSVLDLKPGQRLVGRVSNKVGFGFFVDVGAQRDGLVPLSKMPGNMAQTYSTKLVEGEVVEVWVNNVRQDGTFELTMIEDAVEEAPVVVEDAVDELEGFERPVGAAARDKTKDQIRSGKKESAIKVGVEVKAQWEDGSWYSATVTTDHSDGTVTIAWPEYETETRVLMSKLRIAKAGALPVELLEAGQQLDGTVSRVVSFGAFVDVGAEWDGLVPLSKMGDKSDGEGGTTMQVGETVSVFISQVREDGALELSMVKPRATKKDGKAQDVSSFEGISHREWLAGEVVWVHSTGAFIRVEPPSGGPLKAVEGMVHLSEMSAGYVQDPHAEVEVGQEVQVRVVEVNMALGRLKLSMRDPSLQSDSRPLPSQRIAEEDEEMSEEERRQTLLAQELPDLPDIPRDEPKEEESFGTWE